MSDILVTMSLEEKEFLSKALLAKRAAEEIGLAIDTSTKKTGAASQAQRGMFASINQGLGNTLLAFAGFGSVMAGIQKTAQMIAAEYQNYLSRRTESAAKHISLSDAQYNLYAAAGGGSLSYSELDRLVATISAKTLADPKAVYESLSNAIGAAQGAEVGGRFKSVEDMAAQSVEIAAKLNPTNEQLLEYQSGGVLDVMKAFPQLKDAQGTLGMLITAQKQSRVNDPELFFKHGIKGIAQGAAHGLTPGESMSLNAALATLGVDFSNRTTSNAQGSFLKQVTEAISIAVASGKAPKDLKDRSWTEKLDYIAGAAQSGDKVAIAVREKLLGPAVDTLGDTTPQRRRMKKRLDALRYGVDDLSELTAEQQFYVQLRGLLTAGSPQQKVYRQFLEENKDEQRGRKVYSDLKTNLESSPIQQITRTDQGMKTATTMAQLREPGIAMQGAVLEEMQKLEQALGVTWMAQQIDKFKMSIQNSEPMDRVLSDLIQSIKDREPKPYNRLWNGGVPVNEAEADKDATPQQRYQHETIKQVTTSLDTLRQSVQDNRFTKPTPPPVVPQDTLQNAARREVEAAREMIRQHDQGGVLGRRLKLLRDARGLVNPEGGGWSLDDGTKGGPYNPDKFDLREYSRPDAEQRVLERMRRTNNRRRVPLPDVPVSEGPLDLPQMLQQLMPRMPEPRNRVTPPLRPQTEAAVPRPSEGARTDRPVNISVSIHDPIGRELTRVATRVHPLRALG